MAIYITGDLHGSVSDVKLRIAQISNPTEEDIIIVCGDAGLEYGRYNMGQTKKAMKKFPGKWIIMRGNHDTRYWRDHTHFVKNGMCQVANDGWEIIGDEVNNFLIQKKYPNIWYVEDCGGLYTIQDKNFLFIPGAYSVDKYYRLATESPYEEDEQLFFGEKERILNIAESDKIDYVISHTCPYRLELYISDLFMEGLNQSEVDKSMEEFLDIVDDELKSKFVKWYFGHYHADRDIRDKYTMLYNTVKKID